MNLSKTGLVATEDTARALSTMLQMNKSLTHLDLSGNQKLSNSGAYCVFQGLQHNFTPVHLNLSNTKLVATEDTAQAVVAMLQVNKTITHLNLSKNDFSETCVFQGLQHNTTLVHLNLSTTRNLFTRNTGLALTKMLQVNKTLHTFFCQTNLISFLAQELTVSLEVFSTILH